MPRTYFFLGLGRDGDGHSRVTKGGNCLLVGGSKETHEQMQEVAIKLEERLGNKPVSMRELQDTCKDIFRQTGGGQ